MTWLRNHKRSKFEASAAGVAEKYKDEPQWVIDQILKRETEDVLRRWEEREQRLATVRAKEKQQERGAKRRRLENLGPLPSKKTIDEEAEFLLADARDKDIDGLGGLSKETRRRLEELGLVPSSEKKFGHDEHHEAEDEIKIYYTSRTHSQLTQFVSELRHPAFPPSIPGSLLPQQKKKESPEEAEKECIKHVPLSSRQRLCINPSVSRLGSLTAINERCTELQQGKGGPKCEFFPTQNNLPQTHQFRDTALATVPDIEDLFHLGKTLQVCPYYASRIAIPSAEIVSLPYPLLLQKSARDALGIKLDGNIVIVDEAHNIMDAISNVHAAEISMSELRKARRMLSVYVKRFGKKLKGENRVLVGQVARVVSSLLEWMADVGAKLKADEGIVEPNTLLKAKGADQINLFDLTRYIQSSKLAYKIESYVSHVEEQEKPQSHSGTTNPNLTISKNPPSSAPVLHKLVSFLLSLTHLSSEGRIFYEKIQPSLKWVSGPDIKLSYLLLSPAHVFSSIVSSARAVILAGGTMSPFQDYTTHLFASIPAGRIQTLSCDHAIDPSNLCVWTLAGLGGKMPFPTIDFDFSFQKRGSPELIHQLGIAILNICSVVPDGVVVFFPSYGYLEQVVDLWKKSSGQKTRSTWERLNDKKCVLQEAKKVSSDEILEQYQAIIVWRAWYERRSSRGRTTRKRSPPPLSSRRQNVRRHKFLGPPRQMRRHGWPSLPKRHVPRVESKGRVRRDGRFGRAWPQPTSRFSLPVQASPDPSANWLSKSSTSRTNFLLPPPPPPPYQLNPNPIREKPKKQPNLPPAVSTKILACVL